MGKYILRRLLQAIPHLLLLSFVLFAMANSMGDPLAVFSDSNRPMPEAKKIEMRRRLGLDKPITEQYLVWLIGNDWQLVDVRGDGTLYEAGKRKGVLRGDFGTSFAERGRKALDAFLERLPNTLLLMGTAYLIVILGAIAVGTYSALRQYTFMDNFITAVSLFFFSMPIFFFAIILMYIFGVKFKEWGLPPLPFHGTGDGSIPDLIAHMILPVTALVGIQLAGYTRFIRSSVLEVMNQDYIRTARAKGLAERKVVLLHAFKNAALPLVTLIGLDLPALLAGAVVTEGYFNWPGTGNLFIYSLGSLDIPVLMTILIVISVAVIFFQLLTDVVYTWFDPRIRYT